MGAQIVKDSQGHWRKWCSDELFDVIVWYEDQTGIKIDSFQIFLKNKKKPQNEVGLSWTKEKGFETLGRGNVNSGEASPESNRSPVIFPAKVDIDYVSLLNELRARQEILNLSKMDTFFLESKITRFTALG